MALIARTAAHPAASALASTRFMAGGLGRPSPAGDGMPIEALHAENPIGDDSASFRFQEFQAAEEFYHGYQHHGRVPRRPRRMGTYGFSSLLATTTQSFAEAFALRNKAGSDKISNFLPLASAAAGIGTYEQNARTISNDKPVLGEKLNLTL